MSWARVQTHLWQTEATDQQIAAYVRMLLWCVTQRVLDPVLPASAGRGCPITQEELDALCESPLVADGRLVDYPCNDMNGIAKAAEKGRRGGRPRKDKTLGVSDTGKTLGVSSRGKTPPQKADSIIHNNTVHKKRVQDASPHTPAMTDDESYFSDSAPLSPQADSEGDGMAQAVLIAPGTGYETPSAPRGVSDDEHWRMVVGRLPWVHVLKGCGCCVGAGTWRAWIGVLERTGQTPDELGQFSAGVTGKRWADTIEAEFIKRNPTSGRKNVVML